MSRILFLCTANLYRSPLAAAFFSRKLQADEWSDPCIVDSAGTWTMPGQHRPADLLKLADELDLDLVSHTTQQLDGQLLAQNDLIVVMEKGHQEALQVEFSSLSSKVHLLSELADGLQYDVADPIHSDLNMAEFVAEMSRLIDRAYPNICKLLQTCRTT